MPVVGAFAWFMVFMSAIFVSKVSIVFYRV